MKFCVALCVLLAFTQINAARILGVFPFPAYSHYQLGDTIFKKLAERGHEITVVSPFEQETPFRNFRQVVIDGIFEKAAEMKNSLFNILEYNIVEKIIWIDTLGLNFTKFALESSNVQNFLKENNKFDLVIIHHFSNDALSGFCFHFKAPCVAVSSVSTPNWFSDKVGLSAPPSYAPQLLLSYSSDMNLWQRLYNTIVYVIVDLSLKFYRYPNQNVLLQKHFPGAPHLDDLYYNVSLVLFNGHVSVSDVLPLLPNTIDIAGYHVHPPKKLPEDLQRHLDNATNGVIYFSMGSNLKSKDFSIDKRNAILHVFSKLKQKVLWKFEEDLPNKPNNVIIRPWFPQQDVLAHPNVVLFITHGGILSTIEAVYHGIPMLGIPVFGDQTFNVVKVKNDGYGRYIHYKELNENNLSNELEELLSNPSYSNNAKKRSRIMHDQPVPPLDKAIFWIEYVLRHKGAPHLRSSALTLIWYQYFLLDIFFVIFMFMLIITLLIKLVCKKLCTKCNTNKTTAKKKKN